MPPVSGVYWLDPAVYLPLIGGGQGRSSGRLVYERPWVMGLHSVGVCVCVCVWLTAIWVPVDSASLPLKWPAIVSVNHDGHFIFSKCRYALCELLCTTGKMQTQFFFFFLYNKYLFFFDLLDNIGASLCVQLQCTVCNGGITQAIRHILWFIAVWEEI